MIDFPQTVVPTVTPVRTYLEKVFLLHENLLPLWEADYRTMQEGFIYGESPSFKELIAAISRIQETLHGMQV